MVHLNNFLFYGLLLFSSLTEACYLTAIARVNQTFSLKNRIDGLTYSCLPSSGILVTSQTHKILSFFLGQIQKLDNPKEELTILCNDTINLLQQSSPSDLEVIDKNNNPSIVNQFLDQCCHYFEKENCWPDNHWIFPVLCYVHSFKKGKHYPTRERDVDWKNKYDQKNREYDELTVKFIAIEGLYNTLTKQSTISNQTNEQKNSANNFIHSIVILALLTYIGCMHLKQCNLI